MPGIRRKRSLSFIIEKYTRSTNVNNLSASANNLINHGVTFQEASTVFGDTFSALIAYPAHSGDEDRYVLLGMSNNQRLLVVVHTENDEFVRIISARRATAHERDHYEQGI